MPRGPGKNNRISVCHPDRPHKGRGLCNACWHKAIREENPERALRWSRESYWRNVEAKRASAKLRNQRIKAEVMAAYGGSCVCCGEIELAFLSLDHINGDGHAHRKRVGYGQAVWLDLRRRGYPQGEHRVLCMNCQFGVRQTGGCPHQRRTSGD